MTISIPPGHVEPTVLPTELDREWLEARRAEAYRDARGPSPEVSRWQDALDGDAAALAWAEQVAREMEEVEP